MAAHHPTGNSAPRGTTFDLVVLAGGAGSRLGHADKGLLDAGGRPLVSLLLETLAPGAGRVVISANRNLAHYRTLADTVVSDQRPGTCGPLAGIEAALGAVQAPSCLVVPCDMPALPAALATRLLQGLGADTTAVYAHDGERAQPLCLALDSERARHSLPAYLDSGQRSVHGWLAGLNAQPCDCSDWPADYWRNINDQQALDAFGQA